MEVWPFIPQRGLTESLEWLTNVIRCKAGEERVSLRHLPRQTYMFDCWLTPAEYGYAKVFARSNPRGFLFPMWQHYRNVGRVAWGQTTFQGSFDERFWSGQAIVWDASSSWEVLDIDSASETELVLSGGTVRAYLNATIVPLQEVIFGQNPEFQLSNNDTRVAKLRLKAVGATQLDVPSTFPQHRGVDVLTDPNILLRDLREQHFREVEEIDNGTGIIGLHEVFSGPESESTMNWEALTKEELLSTLEWIHSRRGRRVPFWYRSHNMDLVPQTGLGANPDEEEPDTDIIEVSSVTDLEAPFDIMIQRDTGEELYYRVTEVRQEGTERQELLLEGQQGTWELEEITRISFLVGVRFNSDRIEISYRNGGAARVSVPIVEVPGL